MAATKKRGRPKKVVEPVEQPNPDCEQATKGFVKCLMRKYDKNHTHKQRGGGEVSFVLAIVLAIAFVGLLTFRFDGVYIWMTALATAVAVASAWDHNTVTEVETRPATGDGLCDHPPKYLEKYYPPTPQQLYFEEHARKKECE
jgi:hypothetical protein